MFWNSRTLVALDAVTVVYSASTEELLVWLVHRLARLFRLARDERHPAPRQIKRGLLHHTATPGHLGTHGNCCGGFGARLSTGPVSFRRWGVCGGANTARIETAARAGLDS